MLMTDSSVLGVEGTLTYIGCARAAQRACGHLNASTRDCDNFLHDVREGSAGIGRFGYPHFHQAGITLEPRERGRARKLDPRHRHVSKGADLGKSQASKERTKRVQLRRGMSHRETEHLRVLIANERRERLALVASIVAALGHEVIAREIEVDEVGPVTARERPDVAFVGLGESSRHALGLIERIVHEAACPVIALIHSPDPEFVKEASKRGVFAYINDSEVDDWQNSIDIVLRRFAEFHDLEGAFGRRALTERAKGILMERHSVDEAAAFEMLRDHSRASNRRLIDVATAVVDGHKLLPKQPRTTSPRA